MSKSTTNSTRTGNKSASNTAKKRDVSPTRKENSANVKRVRFAFVPILHEFRQHTKKNEARLWIPVETSLLVRYEFASCSLPTRYIFVAIVLYCGANGLDEIPLDAKFMSSVLVADFRTVEKSFEELLSKNLLQEREKREEKKIQTDRQNTLGSGAVCVDSENLSEEIKAEKTKAENENGLQNGIETDVGNKNKGSQFSIEECLKYVELCKQDGEVIQSPKALANHLHKTGEADAFIFAKLYPVEAVREQFGEPIKFTDQPCSVCFGAKMADTNGKGFRACSHCKNERGKSTGYKPKGETNDEQ